MDSEKERFLTLSVYLTGYRRIELQGTGMLDEYYSRVNTAIDHGYLQKLWSITALLAEVAATEEGDVNAEIKRMIMDDRDLGPIAKNIIKLWYRGDWPDSAAKFGASYTSGRAYQEGLMWRTMRSHAPAAKQPGFGSWSMPPSE
jgi:hypothetical protein